MPRIKLPTKTPIHQNIDEMGLDPRFSPALIDGYMDEMGNTHRRPGLKNFTTTGGAGGVDGLYWWRKGACMIAVQSGKAYKISSDGSVEDITPAGQSMASDVRAIFCEDTTYVFMANSNKIWHYNGAGDAVVMADSEAPINVTHVAFIDGYLLANKVGTSIIQFSNLDDSLIWDALDFFSAKTKEDNVTGISVVWREILAVGRDSMDYYWNDGATPFSRLEGAYIERGCIAPYSLIFADNTYFWLDHTRRFIKLNGRTPEIISTPFDRIIQGYTTVTDCTADLCEIKGRPWIVWSFPTEGKTLVYDLMLKNWYEWGKWNSGTGLYERWLGNCICYARDWNKWLVGGRGAGAEIWELDMDTHTDDGAEIRTVRRTALVDHGGLTRKKSKAVYIKIKRGTGFAAGSPSMVIGSDTLIYTCIRDHTSTADDKPITGSNWQWYWEQAGTSITAWATATAYDAHMPFITFRWKDNNRATWSNDHQLELGKSGQTEVVLSYKRLGIYQTRQWEFIMTDAVPLVLSDVEEEVEPLDMEEEK